MYMTVSNARGHQRALGVVSEHRNGQRLFRQSVPRRRVRRLARRGWLQRRNATGLGWLAVAGTALHTCGEPSDRRVPIVKIDQRTDLGELSVAEEVGRTIAEVS